MIYYKNRVSEGSTVDFLWCRAKYILAKVCPDRKTGIQCNMTQVIEKGAGFSQLAKFCFLGERAREENLPLFGQ